MYGKLTFVATMKFGSVGQFIHWFKYGWWSSFTVSDCMSILIFTFFKRDLDIFFLFNFYLIKVAQKCQKKCVGNLFYWQLLTKSKSLISYVTSLWRHSKILHKFYISNLFRFKKALTLSKVNIHQQNFDRKCILILSKHRKWILRSY